MSIRKDKSSSDSDGKDKEMGSTGIAADIRRNSDNGRLERFAESDGFFAAFLSGCHKSLVWKKAQQRTGIGTAMGYRLSHQATPSNIASNEPRPIINHSITPSNSGLKPAARSFCTVIPAPIINKHTTNRRFERANIP